MEELKDGKFKYVERYVDPMTEKYKKVSVTLTSSSRVAWNKAQRELNTRIDKKLKKVNKSDSTFGEVLHQWHKVYKNTVKPSSYQRSVHSVKIIKRYIPEDYLIRKIDANFVQEMIESIYYEENYSYSSTKQCKTIISAVMKLAKKKKIVEANPVLDVDLKRKPHTYEELERIEDGFLEQDELERLIKKQRAFQFGKRNADITEFLSLTGLRYGELMALKTDNFKGDYIEIDGTFEYHTNKVSDGVKTTTKTKKSTRKVDLSNRAIDILNEIITENELLKRESKFKDMDFLFVTRYGTPIGIHTYNGSIQNAAEQCGITKHISSHIMRHTHISMLAELGIPLKAIMERVGHSKPDTTLKIYTHVTRKTKQNVISKLNGIYK